VVRWEGKLFNCKQGKFSSAPSKICKTTSKLLLPFLLHNDQKFRTGSSIYMILECSLCSSFQIHHSLTSFQKYWDRVPNVEWMKLSSVPSFVPCFCDTRFLFLDLVSCSHHSGNFVTKLLSSRVGVSRVGVVKTLCDISILCSLCLKTPLYQFQLCPSEVEALCLWFGHQSSWRPCQ
jgi:hypothetical protein